MNCIQFAWDPSSRAPKPQTAFTLLLVGQERKGRHFPPPRAQGQTLSRVKLLTSQESLNREDSAPLSQWPHAHLGTSQVLALLYRQGRDKGTAIIFSIPSCIGHRCRTYLTSPGGFKLRPGAMKHPGVCVQPQSGCLRERMHSWRASAVEPQERAWCTCTWVCAQLSWW